MDSVIASVILYLQKKRKYNRNIFLALNARHYRNFVAEEKFIEIYLKIWKMKLQRKKKKSFRLKMLHSKYHISKINEKKSFK